MKLVSAAFIAEREQEQNTGSSRTAGSNIDKNSYMQGINHSFMSLAIKPSTLQRLAYDASISDLINHSFMRLSIKTSTLQRLAYATSISDLRTNISKRLDGRSNCP